MSRILLATTIGLLCAGALSVPALAASVASCRGDTITLRDGTKVESINYYADLIQAQLQQRGYNASNVESWGGCVKAFVTDPDGHSHIMFFDPDTLEPLSY